METTVEVFLDVLILENFIVNFFLLYITSQTIRIKTNIKNYVFGALFGAMYVVVMVYPKLKYLTYFPVKIIVAILIILITYGKRNLIFYLRTTAIFILYSSLLAGVCILIEYNSNVEINNARIIFKSDYKAYIIAIMFIYILIHRLVIYIQDRKDTITLIYNVNIITKHSRMTLKAFLDTGNELREPATNLPVMLVEKDIISDSILKNYDKFYIPYSMVTGIGGQLEGFKPEYVEISLSNKIVKREVIIAFCENRLSISNDYEALLSRGII